MEKEVNINIDAEEGAIIKMLEGRLPQPIEMTAMTIEGNIFAVRKYIEGKKIGAMEGKELDTVILIADEQNKIALGINKKHPHHINIVASLLQSTIFNSFGIESGKRWTINELKKQVRIMRPFFPDKAAHENLLINLGRTDLQVQQIIKEHNDDRGNINNVLEQKVISNVDEAFTLELPIFKGMPPNRFLVNILFEVRDKGVSAWLESTEALEIKRTVWENTRDEQIKFFEETGFTVITQ